MVVRLKVRASTITRKTWAHSEKTQDTKEIRSNPQVEKWSKIHQDLANSAQTSSRINIERLGVLERSGK